MLKQLLLENCTNESVRGAGKTHSYNICTEADVDACVQDGRAIIINGYVFKNIAKVFSTLGFAYRELIDKRMVKDFRGNVLPLEKDDILFILAATRLIRLAKGYTTYTLKYFNYNSLLVNEFNSAEQFINVVAFMQPTDMINIGGVICRVMDIPRIGVFYYYIDRDKKLSSLLFDIRQAYLNHIGVVDPVNLLV